MGYFFPEDSRVESVGELSLSSAYRVDGFGEIVMIFVVLTSLTWVW